ncbi:hypothetical protein LNN31_10380 [Acetobacterium wieringae]|jgi:hypothetical protein|uniref:Uncharacterized protein n=1 Tax=Acetobacterium wieringae TaxID=52694 RepID=A0ABY6H9N1_9FIRM|nr:hypothetical protein [Acetobacterium wieringae]MEA4806249.1 hypothetical protein [Acetobacterium wieringae]UYO61192.1 hypothetical protein LNN31_10380 [Acetobacterium wieringae]VUZ29143.1 Uncharacterised protein [Acetobacterium wieringae]
MDPIIINAAAPQAAASSLAKKVETVTVKPTADSVNPQQAANEANSYYKFDSMELSREYVGYRMKSENSNINSDTDQETSTIDQKLKRIPGDDDDTSEEKDARRQAAKAEQTEDEAVASNQLGSYTNSELKGLVLAGKITMATYNAEIKNRQEKAVAASSQAADLTASVLPTPPSPQQQTQQLQNLAAGQLRRKGTNSIF